MPRNDDPALQLLELNLRIETLRVALKRASPLTDAERTDIESTLETLQAQAQALQAQLRKSA